MGRHADYTKSEITKARQLIEKYEQSCSSANSEMLTLQWALSLFDRLFIGVLIKSNYDYARSRVQELYRSPVASQVCDPPYVDDLFHRELSFLNSLFKDSRTPLFIKKTILDYFKLGLFTGPGASLPRQSYASLEKEIWRFEGYLGALDGQDTLQNYKAILPASMEEHFFKSEFWPRSLKELIIYSSKDDSRSRLFDLMNAPSFVHDGVKDFLDRHTYFHLIGRYLVLAEHFDFPKKIIEGNRMLPYRHGLTLDLISEKLPWRTKENLKDDLERIFDHRPTA